MKIIKYKKLNIVIWFWFREVLKQNSYFIFKLQDIDFCVKFSKYIKIIYSIFYIISWNSPFLNPITSISNKLISPLYINYYIFKNILKIEKIYRSILLCDTLNNKDFIKFIETELNKAININVVIEKFNRKIFKLMHKPNIYEFNDNYLLNKDNNLTFKFNFINQNELNESGVYFLLNSKINLFWPAEKINIKEINELYIGSSTEISKRIKNHHIKQRNKDNLEIFKIYLSSNYLSNFKSSFPNYKLSKGEWIFLNKLTDLHNKILELSLIKYFKDVEVDFLNTADSINLKFFEWNNNWLNYYDDEKEYKKATNLHVFYKLNLKSFIERVRFKYDASTFYKYFDLDELDNFNLEILYKTCSINYLVSKFEVEQDFIWKIIDKPVYFKPKYINREIRLQDTKTNFIENQPPYTDIINLLNCIKNLIKVEEENFKNIHYDTEVVTPLKKRKFKTTDLPLYYPSSYKFIEYKK